MIEWRFEGGAELAKNLRDLPDAVSLGVQRKALRVAAEPIRAHAASMAPRGPDAPHIAENIVIGTPAITGVTAEHIRDNQAVVAVGPEKSFFYGFFWEYGTIKLLARPFMRPAFDTQAGVSLGIIGRELDVAIQTATKRMFNEASARAGSSRAQSTGVGL